MNHEPYYSATYGAYSATNERNEMEVTGHLYPVHYSGYQGEYRYGQHQAFGSCLPSSHSCYAIEDVATWPGLATTEQSFPSDQGLFDPNSSQPTSAYTPIEKTSYYADRATQVFRPESIPPFEFEHRPNPVYFPHLQSLVASSQAESKSPWDPLKLYSEQELVEPHWVIDNGPSTATLRSPWLPDSSSRTYSSDPTRDDHASSTARSRRNSPLSAISDMSFNDHENVCGDCGAEFTGRYARGNLARHCKQKHSCFLPEFRCGVPGCSKEFRRRDKLRDHVRHAHKGDVVVDVGGLLEFENCTDAQSTGEPSWHRCTEAGCDREFPSRAQLNKHQRTHLASAERPYKCSECEQSFLFPKDLRRHEGTHMGAHKTIHCHVSSCSHVFSRRDNLLRHIRQAHPHGDLSEGE